MAVFSVDLFSGNQFLLSGNFTSGDTEFTGSTYNEVNIYADLPDATVCSNKINIVRNDTGAYGPNRKESGMYYSNGSYWKHMGDVTDYLNTDNFFLYDNVDQTKGVKFVTNGLSLGVVRNLTIPNLDGTIALLSDVAPKLNTSTFNTYVNTTAPNTYYNKTQINNYTGETQAQFDLVRSKLSYFSSGVFDIEPTLIDNGNGTATINTLHVLLYPNDDYTGELTQYTATTKTLTFTSGIEEYVCVKLITGIPTIYKETVESNINDSNIIRIFNVWRVGNVIHSLSQDKKGLGLANKIQDSILHTSQYLRTYDGGLEISESNVSIPRRILCSEGIIFAGVIKESVLSYDSLVNSLFQVYHVGGNWTFLQQSGTSYNNTQWDNGINLVTMTDGKYANRWWYRSIGDVREIFYIIGSGEFNTPTAAENEQPPTAPLIPIMLLKHCMPIGKSLILKSATNGVTRSIFGHAYGGVSPIIGHNETLLKQGSIDSILNDQYFHLSSNEAIKIITGGTNIGNGFTLNGIKPSNRNLGLKSLNEGTNILITSSSTTNTIDIKPNIQLTSLSATTISVGGVFNRTITPKGLINFYGVDNTPGDGWNVQNNNIRLDGAVDTDKDIVWQEQGVPKWAAQTYRGEEGKFWYLYNVESKANPLTVYETGRIGVNKQTSTLNYHAVFNGSGLDDLEVGGIYDQNFNTVYEVKINSTTGITDTFIWRKSYNNGYTYDDYSLPIDCNTTPTILENLVDITFLNTTGHTNQTFWNFAGFSQIPQATLTVAPMNFEEVLRSDNYNANPIIYNDITGIANGGPIGNFFEIFTTGTGGTKQALYWGTTVQIDSINFNIHVGGQSLTLIAEYWNGTNWVGLTNSTNKYIDTTLNLSISGRIIWSPNTMTNWIKSYIPDMVESGYELYWMRIRTSTNPTIAPTAHGIDIGNEKRLAIYGSGYDYQPNFYVDSQGRTNIGGGNITGTNVFQINTDVNTPVTSGGQNSLVEFDSADSSVVDLKMKLSSNDLLSPGLTFVKTWGTLETPIDTQTNSMIGRIDFRGRFGSVGTLLSQISSIYSGTGSTRHSDILFNTSNGSDPTENVRIVHGGFVGFGLSAATAVINIKAGTTAIGTAPLKFTSGTLLSAPEAGAIEFLGDNWYGTTTGLTRNAFAFLNSPTFTGSPNLPLGTNLNSQNLSNFILRSGGTNNIELYKVSDFNAYTASTQPTITNAITLANNGLTKNSAHCIQLGGFLSKNTTISGNTYDLSLSAKNLNFTSANNIDIHSIGGTVDIHGNDGSNVEKFNLRLSDTQAIITDSRAIPKGFEYLADYSSTYTNRSLVDKGYVDGVVSGLNPLPAVDVATTANISISSAPATIGGITLVGGMSILVKNQTTGATNGIYTFNGAGNPLTRRLDFDTTAEILQNTIVSVLTGATNKNTTWVLTTPNPIYVNITPQTWVLFSTQAGITQGNGVCVTQSGGNYVISTKSPANSGLCSDNTGIYLNPNTAGEGLSYSTGIYSVNGSSLAGNSLSWSGTQFNVNISGGTLCSALASKVNVSTYCTYTGNTLNSINNKLNTTTFSTYTGTTVPNNYYNKAQINNYTGTTVSNNYYNKAQINSYTGATSLSINAKAPINNPTFTGYAKSVTPAQNDNTTCLATTAWYINQAGTSNPTMNGNVCVGTSNLYTREDHIHPSDTSRLSTTSFNTYSGTTVPNNYYNKAQINSYSGTTVPNNYYNKAQINSYTGATSTTIGLKAPITSPSFLISARSITPTLNDNSTCIATTAWYSNQAGTANPLMNNVASSGTSKLFSRQDHIHPIDTSRLAVTTFAAYTGNTKIVSSNKQIIFNNNGVLTGNTNFNYCTSLCSLQVGSTSVASGNQSFAIGGGTASGSQSFSIDGGQAIGLGSFSEGTSNYACAAHSSILGGSGNTICSTALRSAIIGGSGISLTGSTYNDYTAVKNLAIFGQPSTGSIGDYNLTWNANDKKIKATKLTGGTTSYYYLENTTNCCTALTAPAIRLCLVASNFVAGTYQIDYSTIFGNTASNNCSFIQFGINGTIQGKCISERSSSWYTGMAWSASLSRDVVLAGGTNCLTVEYWTTANCACSPYAMVRATRIC